jgi:predicted transposase YbfD/YdcC
MTKENTFLANHFSSLKDPRIERTKKHKLLDIIIIAVCSVLAGCLGWEEIEIFGIEKEIWFKNFLDLENGIPSHDTFSRVFARLDPIEFQKCFFNWVNAIQQLKIGAVVAIDGKTLRHSFDKLAGKSSIHMVSAFASDSNLVLGQIKVDAKTNEITAIPSLFCP